MQERSLELAEELARENKVKVDAGQIPPLDLCRRKPKWRSGAKADSCQQIAEDAEDALRRLIVEPSDVAFWGLRLEAVDEPPALVTLPDDAAVAKAPPIAMT